MDNRLVANILEDLAHQLREEDKKEVLPELHGKFTSVYFNGSFYKDLNEANISISSKGNYYSFNLTIRDLEKLERAIHKAKVEWYNHFTEQNNCSEDDASHHEEEE